MKKYLFIVTLATGLSFVQSGTGTNKHAALMDACMSMDDSQFPEDEVVDIQLKSVEDLK